MSLLSRHSLLDRISRSKDSRKRLVNSNVDKEIAYQIRVTRDAREWTQSDLAREAGMSQNNISRLESPEYGKHTISSLKRIAEALDVALVVRLVPFGQYISWLSGTPYTDRGLRPEALAVPSFTMERAAEHRAEMQEAVIEELLNPKKGKVINIDNYLRTSATEPPTQEDLGGASGYAASIGF